MNYVSAFRDEFVPNEETIAAMKEARVGNLNIYSDLQEMLSDILR